VCLGSGGGCEVRGCVDELLENDIQLKVTRPVKLLPYRFAPPKMAFLRDHIKKL
jgi:hypothetical protein